MDAHVQVIADACAAVDAVLGLRFSVPFTAPLPPIVGEAAKVFACEMCYQRRGVGADTNPWTTQANTLRSTLEKIASGKLPLAPTIQRQQPSGTLISEPSRTHDNGGRRMA